MCLTTDLAVPVYAVPPANTNVSSPVASRVLQGKHSLLQPSSTHVEHLHSMRRILQQQIREKDAQIDKVLSKVNPAASTKLTLMPERLPLSEEERNKHRDVLAYLRRSRIPAASRVADDDRLKFDISTFEDYAEVDSDFGPDSSDPYDVQCLTSFGRGLSHEDGSFSINSILERAAPAGIMAKAALETGSARNNMAQFSACDGNTAIESYFLPGTSHSDLCPHLLIFDTGPLANLELRRLIVERQVAPDILLSGLVTPNDAVALFQMYVVFIRLSDALLLKSADAIAISGG